LKKPEVSESRPGFQKDLNIKPSCPQSEGRLLFLMKGRKPLRSGIRENSTANTPAPVPDLLRKESMPSRQNCGKRRLRSPTFATPFDYLTKRVEAISWGRSGQRRSASVQRAAAPAREATPRGLFDESIAPIRNPAPIANKPVLSASRFSLVEQPKIEIAPAWNVSGRGAGKGEDENVRPRSRQFTRSQVQPSRVRFDVQEEAVEPQAARDADLAKTQKPFKEPTDFSRPYRYPSQYLSSQIVDDDSEAKPQGKKPAGLRFETNDALAKIAPLDEFVKMESDMKEADEDHNDRVVLNYQKMLRIVKDYIDDGTERRTVVRTMTVHRNDHFVLLLSRPVLNMTGLYVLKADLSGLEKLWGSGPVLIKPAEVDTCWYYNVITKEFVGSQRRAFQTNLDAVSL
jgi:hypothetical protein